MKHLIVLWITMVLGCGPLQAQYNSARNKVWVMGNRVGLDFNMSPPQVVTSNMQNGQEGCASVCATSGQLLFYTNGTDAWTASGTIMPNGTNFNGSSTTTYSTTQGALIVPDPGNDQRYYLFSLTSMDNSQLFCDVVDMNLNNGLGDIDTGFVLHQQMIMSGLTEKMTAVAGCQDNIWIIVHRQQQALFRTYELTSFGLNLEYVESGWGMMPAQAYSGGVIKAAPSGNKVVVCNTYNYGTGIEIYDFDKTTGVLSNALLLDSGAYYGAAFSPGNNLLYGQKVNSQEIYQFDLTNMDPGGSKLLLGGSRAYSDMKIGPDSMIYFISRRGMATKYLGRLEQPDIYGPACDFRDSIAAIAFENTTYAHIMYGLPNDVVAAVPAERTVNTLVGDTLICRLPASGLVLEATPGYYGYQWNDGSPGSQKVVDQEGTYWVRYKLPHCGLGVDTFRIQLSHMPQPQITVSGNLLQVVQEYATYQWFRDGMPVAGAQQASYVAPGEGWYQVVVADQAGCRDSADIVVAGSTLLNERGGQSQVILYPNPAKDYIMATGAGSLTGILRTLDGRSVKNHQFDKGPLSLANLAPGSYLLYLYDKENQLLKISRIVCIG